MLIPEAYDQLFKNEGTRIRLFRAVPCECANIKDGWDSHSTCEVPGCEMGYIYLEEPGAASVGVAIDVVRTTIMHPQFGMLLAGDLTLTAMPDQLYLNPYDKVLMTGWRQGATEQLTKGQDVFNRPWAQSVQMVRDTTRLYPATSYTLTVSEATGESRLSWIAGQPQPATNAYYAVVYQYLPLYWAALQSEEAGRPTQASTRMLPRTVRLAKERPTNNA